MDCLILLEEDKSECDGKWIDENLFPVGEKTKGTISFLYFSNTVVICYLNLLSLINCAKQSPLLSSH